MPTQPQPIPRSSPALTDDDIRIKFNEAKRLTKTKNMQGLVERVGEELGRAHPNIKSIELHYEMHGRPKIKGDLKEKAISGEAEDKNVLPKKLQTNNGLSLRGSSSDRSNLSAATKDTDDSQQIAKSNDHKEENFSKMSKMELANPEVLERMFGPKRGEGLGRQNEDGSFNYINPETGEYQKERPKPSKQLQLQSAASSEVYKDAKGNEHRKSDYDPYKERLLEKGQSGELPGWGDNWKARLGHEMAKAKGKLAGKAIKKIAEQQSLVSVVIIYGLAFANDFPDLGMKVLGAITFGLSGIADFLFDVVVTLGFRYFLRSSINVPGVKALIYTAGFLEVFGGPLDVLPFWTICAWLALSQIKKQQEIQQEEKVGEEEAAIRHREQLQGAMEGF